MHLTLLAPTFAVCRLAPADPVPAWAGGGQFSSVTRTTAELSVVCEEAQVPTGVRAERSWRALRVVGTLDFSLVGVVLGIAQPLADAGVAIFVISTFDTDYVLLKQESLELALAALRAAGHSIED